MEVMEGEDVGLDQGGVHAEEGIIRLGERGEGGLWPGEAEGFFFGGGKGQ